MLIKKLIKKVFSKYKYWRRIKTYDKKEIINIAIVFYIPKANIAKYKSWEDGFTKAIDLLSNEYKITWFNLANKKPNAEILNKFDFLIVKSCWDWIVDTYIRSVKGLKVPIGLAISCSKLPKDMNSIYAYDVLWYETFWYGQFFKKHSRAFHAFGIDTDVFKFKKQNKEYDVISIGQLAAYKRHENIINQAGDKKLVIGDTNTLEGEQIRGLLQHNNIEIIDFVNQNILSDFINKSKLVYIPATLNGGGERAVLEARSCGVEVKIEDDNLKLKELLTCQIWDEKYYFNNLKKGILSILK